MYWILALFISLSTCFAEVGTISKIVGPDAYILRAGNKLPLTIKTELEENDQIITNNSHAVLFIYPGVQVALAKNTEVKLTESRVEELKDSERSTSQIDVLKGIIRVLAYKNPNQEIDFRVQTEGATFSVRGTEFEVSVTPNKDVLLDVSNGQVEASSPFIQSFVPEYVKAQEGLTFSSQKKKFIRRKMNLNFKNHLEFQNNLDVNKTWKKIKETKAKKATRAEKRKGSRPKP